MEREKKLEGRREKKRRKEETKGGSEGWRGRDGEEEMGCERKNT